MTTVFIYEDVTATGAGGGLCSPPAPSLLAEGRAMLDAVAADFAAVPGVNVVTVGEPGASATGANATPVADAPGSPGFRELAVHSDFTLVIAPECDGRLERLCGEVERAGGRLLGPSPDAIRLTADKLMLARHWERRGVPTPATWELGAEPSDRSLVVKPRHGAGSQAITLWRRDSDPVGAVQERSPVPTTGPERRIAQEYVPGVAASVAFLISPSQTLPLVPCRQLLSTDGRFQYLGGRLPIAPELAARAVRIATAAIGSVPGLLGYVGVDVVLGDNGRDWAIEINPRLTTSYVGLRALARCNLAEAMLAAALGEPVPAPDWHPGAIEFTPDGRIRAGSSTDNGQPQVKRA